MALESISYYPAPVPVNHEHMPRYVSEELRKVSAAITSLASGHLDKSHAEPEKPRDGDIRYADGTDWNPGSGGAGIYYYNGSTWTKLG